MLFARWINDSGFRKYFVNTSWMLSEKIIRMVMTLFVGVYVARYLGPDRFGILSYALSLVGIISAISLLGMDDIIVRDFVQKSADENEILGTAFGLKLAGSTASIILLAGGLLFGNCDPYLAAIILIIAGGMLFQSFGVIDFYFRSKVEAKFTSRALLLSVFVVSTFKIILVWMQAPLVWFAVSFLLENSLLAFFLLTIYRMRCIRPKWRFKKSVAVRLLKNSLPLLGSSIAIMIYMRIDQIMIRHYAGDQALGYYAAAVRISEACYFIPAVICTSLFPAIINSRNIGREFYNIRLQRLYDLLLWIAIAIAIPMTLASDFLIQSLFGDQFGPASEVLQVHIWSAVFVFFGVASGKYLIAENFLYFSFIRTIFGAFINVFLNMILIPTNGIVGAAWATFFSYGSVNISLAFFSQTRNNFFLMAKSFFPFKRILKH